MNEKKVEKDVFMWTISMVLILSFLGGCTTTMVVNVTDPDGMPIYAVPVTVGNNDFGRTPNANGKISDFIFANRSMTAVAEGYTPVTTKVERSLRVGRLIGGIFIVPVLLFAYAPNPHQNITLTPEL